MAFTRNKTAAVVGVSPAKKHNQKASAKFYTPIAACRSRILTIGDDGKILLTEEVEKKKAMAAATLMARKKFDAMPIKFARPNVACRTGETKDAAWEEVFVKSQSETIKIASVREFKLPATPKSRTKRAKNFTLDVTIAEKAYIAGHSNHALGELRLIYDRNDTTMLNKTTDNIDDEPRQDRDLHVAKKKATHHLRSASISPELLRQKAASRLDECHMLKETTNLLTQDPAIESINHVFGSPYRARPATRKEANRFHDLLSRLAAARSEMADPAIVSIKVAPADEKAKPQEVADKIVAAQEQLAEKARFKRSDSGFVSPPSNSDEGQASGSNSAPAENTPEHPNSKGGSEKSKTPDSGFNSTPDAPALNPKAKEFISLRTSPTKGANLAANQSDIRPIHPYPLPKLRDPREYMDMTDYRNGPVAPAFNDTSCQDLSLGVFPDPIINAATFQEVPSFMPTTMMPPPPPPCPPCPPFPMGYEAQPAFYPPPPPGFGPGARPAPFRKPRGHNAAEQQQYEAWLEYKRSTDPTFHQKGKQRQMRRAAARQNQ